MPLSLLLQSAVGTLRAASRALTPWIDIVGNESTIVERARSAFLVHWFGHRLPFNGLSLRSHIVNIAELDAQFRAAQKSVRQSEGAPNLTEPLLGFAGMLGGLLLSPVGMVAAVSLLWRFTEHGWTALVVALLWFGGLLTGLVLAPAGTGILLIGGLTALAAAIGLSAALADQRPIRGAFDLFGALARLMNAGLVFVGQLTGERSGVRNPLLKKVLELGDRAAALFAQALGALAFLVVRVGPVLEPVASTLVGIGELAGGTFAAVGAIVDGLKQEFTEQVVSGRTSIVGVLAGVGWVARRQSNAARDVLVAQLDVLIDTLSGVGPALGSAFGVFVGEARGFVRTQFTGHPTIRVVGALLDQADVAAAAFNPPPAKNPAGNATAAAANAGPGAFDQVLAALPPLPPAPTFPTLPVLPDRARLARQLGAGTVPALDLTAIEQAAAGLGGAVAPVELTEQARASLARLRRGPGLFAAEQAALTERFGPPAEALELNRLQLQRFRDAFSVIVGQLLPAKLRGTAAPQLAAVFESLDRTVYATPKRAVPADRLPVLDLPDNDRLRPEVRTLRLRMPGAPLGTVRRFETLLLDRLRRQEYPADGPAPAPTGTGAR
jgi:hypothetical protein